MRTNMDWSKHIVTENHSDNCKIWTIEIPGDPTHLVRFINARGTMMVNGDFGNWVFNREFYPGEKTSVSDSYWIEKLQIASSQEPFEYDEKASEQAIKDYIAERIADRDFLTDEENEYFQNCLYYIDDELEYKNAVFRNYPSGFDYETTRMFYCESPQIWLQYVFDAFDETCRRMKSNK